VAGRPYPERVPAAWGVNEGDGRLLERVEERRALADALRAARRGEGGVVVVDGAIGLGKTALLSAFRADAAGEATVASAQGTELERDFAFGVVLQLLAPVVGEDAEVFSGAAALARPLFERAEADTGRDSIFPLLHGLHWLCAGLADREPLVLCVDDLQWADEPSRRFLAYLGARAPELPALIVATRRTGEQVEGGALEELGALPATVQLRPAELSREAVGELARDELGEEADKGLGADCWERSGGNPLFVRELLRAAREAGENGDPAAEIALPETVANLIERRVSRAPAGARAVASGLAILGDSAGIAELEAVAELDADEALAGLDQLAATDLTDPAEPSRFRHPIVRQAIAASIPAGERSRLRMRAARALAPRDPKRAAAHLIAARPDGPSGEPWAAELLREAASRARAGGGQEAIAYLRRALSEPMGAGERRETLLELGKLEANAGDGAALERLAEATALAPDPVERARIALVRGDALFHLVALEECSRVCREAIAELGDRDRELRLALEGTALNADALRGMRRERPVELAEEVSAGVTPGERAVLAHVIADLAATGAEPAGSVRALGRRALADGKLLEEVGPSSPIYIYAGTAMAWAGAYEAVLETTAAGLEEARRRGSLIGISYSAALRSGTALLAGDLALAESDAELVVSGLPGADPMSYAVALAWLIEALVERGRIEEARLALERSGLTGELPELGTIDFLLLARASLAEAGGDIAAALEEVEEVGRRADRARYLNPAAIDWRSRCAGLLAAEGDRERALELAEDAIERARGFGAPRAVGVALRTRGSILGGADGTADLREAAALLDGVARVEHARATVELGRALHAAGEEEARETLYSGMDLAHRAGAHALVEEAMEALRAAGARPRRPRVTGVDALTPQERRIAQMAAEGAGNREIAEALFLTRRTVEMHLSNAYRKLDIESREELPAAFRTSSCPSTS
jgi:DNA-binding CsgD family transcriptional regulator